MPFAHNAVDSLRVYFEDDGGDGPPVVILNGLGDPIASSRRWGISNSLAAGYRIILVDHRGHGQSDKPHTPEAYTTPLRVADVVAVLDALHIERAHFIGASWGARLLFGVGEHARGRTRSLTMGGQTPFAMNRESRGVRMVTQAFASGSSMADFLDALGGFGDVDAEVRSYTLANDFDALAAAWHAAMEEGAVAEDLVKWDVPCLIYAGSEDLDFFEGAKRAAAEIPGARFVALQGLSHLEAHENVEDILPHMKRFLEET